MDTKPSMLVSLLTMTPREIFCTCQIMALRVERCPLHGHLFTKEEDA